MGPTNVPRWRSRILVGLVLALTQSAAGQEDLIFRANADLAVVHALVLAGGRPALGLRVEDFQVFEDGRERPISVFIPPEWKPMEIVLALDTSGSMYGWPTKEATTLLLDSLHPGSCVLLLPFQESIGQGIWGHPGDPGLRQRIADIEFGANEVIFDALLASFSLMEERQLLEVPGGAPLADSASTSVSELMRFRGVPGALDAVDIPRPIGDCAPRQDPWSALEPLSSLRRAIVVVTDGADFASRSSLDDVLLVAWGSNLPVFILAAEPRASSGGFGTMGRPSHYGTIRKLERLVEYTGGAMFRATQSVDDQEVFNELQRLIAGLRSQYVVGYVPTGESSDASVLDRHDIEVRVRDGDHEVVIPDHVVRGKVATDNSVLNMIHRGFRQIAAGHLDQALETFDVAASAGPGQAAPQMAAIHYGRGIAHSRLGQHEKALEELRLAAEQAPWLPDLEARQAELYLQIGDFDSAWRHALRGHAQGSDVTKLVEQLQELKPREDVVFPDVMPSDLLQVQLQAQAKGDAALQGIVVPALMSAVGRALAASRDVVLVDDANSVVGEHRLTLRMDIDRIHEHGRRIEVKGWLMLSQAGGDEISKVRLHLNDVRAEEEASREVEIAVQEIRAEIEEYRQLVS